MNIEQVAIVLGKAAAIDNRDVGRAAVLAWNEIIGPLELEDALAAVTRHRRESPGVYLEPGHVLRLARIIRDERRRGEVVRALPPGRFDFTPSDVDAEEPMQPEPPAKVRAMLSDLAAKRSIPGPSASAPKAPPTRSESIRERALARAHAEKRGRCA